MRILGTIADDVTGATDIGSVLASVGRDVIVVFDTARSADADLEGVDAIIVALKTRTAPVGVAVGMGLDAIRWTVARGAEQFFFKYCSTFDSTPRGNIGPVIDALVAELALPVALVAPAYPRNGRTVTDGRLFVQGVPLDESPMRHHPLTPMTDSRLAELLRPQTALAIDALPLASVRADGLRDALAPGDGPRAVIADATTDDDLVRLARASGDHVLLTGGAGLALGLGDSDAATRAPHPVSAGAGERLVLSGSASATTRRQIAHARAAMPVLKLDPDAVRADSAAYADRVFAWVGEQWDDAPGAPVLVYATDSLDDLASREDPLAEGEAVEAVLGLVAQRAAADRLGALIVAGGETSGRVVQDLGIASLRVGRVIAPGVVWADAATSSGRIALSLKSGNFGADDMFTEAWELLA